MQCRQKESTVHGECLFLCFHAIRPNTITLLAGCRCISFDLKIMPKRETDSLHAPLILRPMLSINIKNFFHQLLLENRWEKAQRPPANQCEWKILIILKTNSLSLGSMFKKHSHGICRRKKKRTKP